MDFGDFLKSMIEGRTAPEMSRTPVTAAEAACQDDCSLKMHALRKKAKAYMKKLDADVAELHAQVWDLVAQRHGYANNKAAIADGVTFEIDGDAPEDGEDEAREVVMRQDPTKAKPKAEQAEKKSRFIMPN